MIKEAFRLDIPTVPLSFQKFVSPGVSGVSRCPPIVFLHGLCGSKKNNRSSSRILSHKLLTDVYSLDLRNHGDSPHNTRHDTVAMASDVEAFIKDHKLHKPIIIGHSMGAKTAMAVALRRPELPSMVISVDNVPAENVGAASEFHQFEQRLRALQEIDESHCHDLKQAKAILAKVEPSEAVQTFILANLHKEHSILRSKIPPQILINSLKAIQGWEFGYNHSWSGPALLMRATKSPFAQDYKKFTLQFPNGELQEIDSGHWIITDEPKWFNKTCEDFIKRHLSA